MNIKYVTCIHNIEIITPSLHTAIIRSHTHNVVMTADEIYAP